MDALDLRRGHSFLNVGSGTGYLSTIVASLIGPYAIHHGVELRGQVVKIARQLLRERGLHSIQFHNCSIFSVDASASIQFDRIWVGAGATAEDLSRVVSMLRVGGVVVGPFEDEEGEQRLQKVTRLPDSAELDASGSKARSHCEVLLAVRFEPLVRTEAVDAPVVLRRHVWGSSQPLCFPPSFVHVAATLFLCVRDQASIASMLPWDVWHCLILPRLPHDAFEASVKDVTST